jgi:hypothetical protein
MTAEELTALEHASYPAPDKYGLALDRATRSPVPGGRFSTGFQYTAEEITALEHAAYPAPDRCDSQSRHDRPAQRPRTLPTPFSSRGAPRERREVGGGVRREGEGAAAARSAAARGGAIHIGWASGRWR